MFYSLCLCFLAYDIICHNFPNSLSLEVLGFTHTELTWGSRSVSLTGLFWVFSWNLATLNSPSWPMLCCGSQVVTCQMGPVSQTQLHFEKIQADVFSTLQLSWSFFGWCQFFFPPLQKINSSGLGCLHHRGQLCHLCTICKQAASEAKVTGMNTEAEKQRKSCLCPFHRIPSVNSHSCCKKCFIIFF